MWHLYFQQFSKETSHISINHLQTLSLTQGTNNHSYNFPYPTALFFM